MDFESEMDLDAALQESFARFDARLRGHDTVTECYQIIDPGTARSIENAATWAEYGSEFSEWAEKMRERGGFSDRYIEADPR